MFTGLLAFALLLAEAAAPGEAAPAGAPGAPQPSGVFVFLIQGFPIFLLVFLFWLLAIRPQTRKERDRRKMQEDLKRADTVVTEGGLLGVVAKVKGNVVWLMVDDDSKMRLRVHRRFIRQVLSNDEMKKEEEGTAAEGSAGEKVKGPEVKT